jgi:hypothetical protein
MQPIRCVLRISREASLAKPRIIHDEPNLLGDRRMRATLDIDEDLLRYLNEHSQDTGMSTGAIASGLMREALSRRSTKRVRNGVPLFTRSEDSDVVVTMELVNEIRDEAP